MFHERPFWSNTVEKLLDYFLVWVLREPETPEAKHTFQMRKGHLDFLSIVF